MAIRNKLKSEAMTIRDKLKLLQKAMRGHLEAIPQADGTTFYFDVEEVRKELFIFWRACLRADYNATPRPELPKIVCAVANAKDRRAAYEKLPLSDYLPLDAEALVEEGRCVPRSRVVGHDET